jgi:hypothetical protein
MALIFPTAFLTLHPSLQYIRALSLPEQQAWPLTLTQRHALLNPTSTFYHKPKSLASAFVSEKRWHSAFQVPLAWQALAPFAVDA